MAFIRAALLVIFSCLWAGCVDDSSSYQGIPAITLLSADPTTFLGRVPCGVPGGVQRYVVSIQDVGPQFPQPARCIRHLVDAGPDPDTCMPSSGPARCTELVSFTPTGSVPPSLITLDYYVAKIDGYDRDDIVPRGGAGSGSQDMVDSVTEELVPPRWTTGCGRFSDTSGDDAATSGDGTDPSEADAASNPLEFPTQVLGSIEVFLHGCLPFEAAPATDAGADGDPTDGQPDAAPPVPSPGARGR